MTEAIDVIESGKPKMLEFGVADDTAWKVGLSCGGTIRVYGREGGCDRHPAKLDDPCAGASTPNAPTRPRG